MKIIQPAAGLGARSIYFLKDLLYMILIFLPASFLTRLGTEK